MSTPSSQPPSDSQPLKKAVIYARMSTEHQQYSTQNQIDVIHEYAAHKNMEVVRIYADEGKSGLNLAGRESLKALFDEVMGGNADFEVILVYDISRWGRFQDADESAYYEYICRRAGITVIYCAEQFENDGSPVATIVKSVKRAMAGEYSRELSNKVFIGQCRLIQLGFRQGGMAGFGLRRMLIDQQGAGKGELAIGEQKSIQTDRVVLVPGPKDEVGIVREIYERFVSEGKQEREIAEALNSRNLRTDLDRPWTRGTVHQILTNEKYIGNNVFNRLSFKLKKRRIHNPPEMWVRAEGVFQAIVEPTLFEQAQAIILERSRKLTDEELVEKLKEIYIKTGYLSALVIDEFDGAPSSSAYQHRFGGLLRAYQMVGYIPDHDYQYLEINRRLRQMHRRAVEETIRRMRELGGRIDYDETTGIVRINDEITILLVIARCLRTPGGGYRWNIRLTHQPRPDITVVVRMDEPNLEPLDYYLLPTIDLSINRLRLAENNGLYFDTYRFDNLGFLIGMAQHIHIEVAS